MLTKYIKQLETRLGLKNNNLSKPQFKRIRQALDKIYILLLLKFLEINLPGDMLLPLYKELDVMDKIAKNPKNIEKFFVKYLQLIPHMTVKLEAFFEANLVEIKYKLSQIIKATHDQ